MYLSHFPAALWKWSLPGSCLGALSIFSLIRPGLLRCKPNICPPPMIELLHVQCTLTVQYYVHSEIRCTLTLNKTNSNNITNMPHTRVVSPITFACRPSKWVTFAPKLPKALLGGFAGYFAARCPCFSPDSREHLSPPATTMCTVETVRTGSTSQLLKERL